MSRSARRHGTHRPRRGVITVAVIAILALADRQGWLLVRHRDDVATYDGITARVVRVVTGDTIEIDVPDRVRDRPRTRIRLWGIDCPSPGSDPVATRTAAEAVRLVRSTVGGGPVALRLERHRTRDGFGRVLVHLELADGSTLNERLLEAGLGHVVEHHPHEMLIPYARAEGRARTARVGLWSDEERG